VLAQLLSGHWRDPEAGALQTVPAVRVAIEPSLCGKEAELVAPLRLGRAVAVVSDQNTRRVLGHRVESALSRLGTVLPIVLDNPHADAATAQTLRQACASSDALVAVGSGTINDLCKFVAAADRKPYAVFATAPSMNGYASRNAAITVDGHKQTLPAAPPVGIFMDLEVLAAAPARLIRAGMGDSLCRSTAQADWLLSHHLLGTPYRTAPFTLLADDEPGWMREPEALLHGDLTAMEALARTLVLSGLGMTICDGSYPASQGEHLISHYIDMFAPPSRGAYFHGEQVAVATLTMASIQERMLRSGVPQLHSATVSREDLGKRFGPEVGDACWCEYAPKHFIDGALRDLQARVAALWSEIVIAMGKVTIPAGKIRSVLERAGCPTTPEEIGLTPAFYATAVRDGRFLRNRYTFLDLADSAGMLAAMHPT
jgi:glycerol-1-phosphate dehydrogenase [NAD(P)+]